MSITVLNIIKPKLHLRIISRKEEITNKIVGEVVQFIDLVENDNIELLTYVANLVENIVVKKDNIDKDELIIYIYKRLFPNLIENKLHSSTSSNSSVKIDDDIEKLKTNLKHLRDNHLIHKISYARYFCYYLGRVGKKLTPKI
jgi:hypothetical protein